MGQRKRCDHRSGQRRCRGGAAACNRRVGILGRGNGAPGAAAGSGGGMSRLRPNALARKTPIHGRPFEIFHWKPIHKRHPELTPKETNGATMITLPPSLRGGRQGCAVGVRQGHAGIVRERKCMEWDPPMRMGRGRPPPHPCHAKPFGCCEALAAAHGGGAEAAPQIQHTASSGSGPVPHGPAAGAQRPGRRVGGGGGVERGGG